MISIVTPTYNRAKFLNRLFRSLKSQLCTDFEWIIIDDGSTDETRATVNRFIFENAVDITYIAQENRGKHVAINSAVKHCRGEWTFIVDSDDMLTPDAISTLSNHLSLIQCDRRFCGISAVKTTLDRQIIGRQPESDITDVAFFDFYHKLGYNGDRALVFRTDLLRENPFPIFDNEKFLPEGILWETISRNKLVRFITTPVYICEYQTDGLSARYHDLMISNPIGNALYYKILSEHPDATFLTRVRCSFMHRHLLNIAIKNGCDISAIKTSGTLRFYHLIAPVFSPFYKLKSLFKQFKASK